MKPRQAFALAFSVLSVYGMTMDVSINERNLARIRRKVESGKYSSTDDVIGNALALLDERDEALESELAEMRESVRRGTTQADAGEVAPSEEVFDELRRRNSAMAKQAR